MSRRTNSIDRAWFDALYAGDADPWRFASSPYEREKYAASLAALPDRRFPAALEVGCSIGIFTRQLATRCDRLLSIDVAEAALAQARMNCRAPHVTFANAAVPGEWPDGQFDLIVFSEVLYYLDRADIARAAACASDALRQAGAILMVHYLGATDYPVSGDTAADWFIANVAIPVSHQSRTNDYRIDVLSNRAPENHHPDGFL